jgi:hypothetical protein
MSHGVSNTVPRNLFFLTSFRKGDKGGYRVWRRAVIFIIQMDLCTGDEGSLEYQLSFSQGSDLVGIW